jgi:glycerol-3-phosphate cytidylyltransferase
MKTGFVASCFDLLHAGHCLMLQDAKEQCDYLVVALQVDPSVDRPEKNKPVQSLDERRIQLESIKYVDEIQLYETEEDLKQLLHEIRPNVRVLGTDYVGRVATGQEYSDEVYYHDRNHGWSTSELRNRILREAI